MMEVLCMGYEGTKRAEERRLSKDPGRKNQGTNVLNSK